LAYKPKEANIHTAQLFENSVKLATYIMIVLGLNMDHSVHNKLVSFIWSIADDCLRDVYVRGKYRDIILPMVVLRRLDTLLEPTKDAILAEVQDQQAESDFFELDDLPLRHISGYVFYNSSQ